MLNRKLGIILLILCLVLISITIESAGFEYSGTSADTKPSYPNFGLPVIDSIFLEIDTQRAYKYDGLNWVLIKYAGLSTDTKPGDSYFGMKYFETDTKDTYIYDGLNWNLFRVGVNITGDVSGTKDINIVSDVSGTKDVNIVANDVPIKYEFFDVSIYPVAELLTTTGVQYGAVVTNGTTSYIDLFDFGTDTYFPDLGGTLAWVYVNISFELKGGTNLPVATYKLEAKNSDLGSWTIMSAEETYPTTGNYVGKRLEGYLLITTDAIDDAPFDIRLQFKTDTADGDTETVSARLKNTTVIRLVGTRK